MGLFQPIDESIHDVVNANSVSKHMIKNGTAFKQLANQAGVSQGRAENNLKKIGIDRNTGSYAATQRFGKEATRSAIAGIKRLLARPTSSNYSKYAARESTEGISLSTKKLLSAGGHNSSDLNAVKPNAEYCDQYDKHFIGDGEDPETSRYNVPAILAAKTAGGAPFDQTLSNGINRASADVFHLKKLRDDEGMND